MKIKIEFESDAPDFNKLSKREPKPQVRVRLIAMAQLKAGKKIVEVACSIGVDRHSIKNWYKKYKENGLDGLSDLPRPGRKPNLPKDKEKEFIKKIAALREEKDGGRITGYSIRDMALKDFGADYADDSIYTVLKRLKISWTTGLKTSTKDFRKQCKDLI